MGLPELTEELSTPVHGKAERPRLCGVVLANAGPPCRHEGEPVAIVSTAD